MNLDLAVEPAWAIGLFLAQLRTAVFVIAAPQLGVATGRSGRWAFAVAVGAAISSPVDVSSTGDLLGHGLVNVGIGALLGWGLGLLFHTFAVAGGMTDLSASTSIASTIDPTRGEQGAVFSRLFAVVGLTLFHVSGGLTLLVTVLGWSVKAVPLDGQMDVSGDVADVLVGQVGTLMVLGVEMAAPVIASLFLVELILGLAARFAPTANVFLLGMPVKVGLAMSIVVTMFAMFPTFTDGIIETTRDTAIDVLNGVGVEADVG